MATPRSATSPRARGRLWEFQQLLTRRLTRPDGQQRRVATIPTGEIVDRYGRMLAYLAPWFAGGAADPLPPRGDPTRRTFNYDMVAAGWAAPFLIYPSLPGNDDLNLFYEAAKAAWADARGAWAVSGRTLLLGYEYRLAIKLGTAETPGDGMTDAFQRICIDLRTNRSVGLHGWHDVPPPERLWVWTADQDQARKHLAYTD